MSKEIRITLDSVDMGQLLDGLRLRADAWRKTAQFLELGYVVGDAFICEECLGVDEAVLITQHYERIIISIERQVVEQGGW